MIEVVVKMEKNKENRTEERRMSRGESSGGGQSCLGYLFEWSDSNSNINHPNTPKMLSLIPPYAIDDHNINHPLNPITTLSSPKPPSSISLINSPSSNNTNTNTSSNPPPQLQQYLGNFVTDRPSTKVKSVPGGDSSLGYLFGDR